MEDDGVEEDDGGGGDLFSSDAGGGEVSGDFFSEDDWLFEESSGGGGGDEVDVEVGEGAVGVFLLVSLPAPLAGGEEPDIAGGEEPPPDSDIPQFSLLFLSYLYISQSQSYTHPTSTPLYLLKLLSIDW